MFLRVWNRQREAVMALLSWSFFKMIPNKGLENKNHGTRPLISMFGDSLASLDQFLHCQ